MAEIDDGGPAFPQNVHVDMGDSVSGQYVTCTLPKLAPGMSLRDWFAGQAFGALVTRCDKDDVQPQLNVWAGILADHAYVYADAMLEARKEKG